MIKRILYLYILIMCPGLAFAQINTDRVMAIGRNALYFEDYVLSIQYFNQVVNAKPYLADPYFYRGLAKINLDDFQGAESDCSEAIERNPFVVSAYQVRGLARIRQDNYAGAIEDYMKALEFDPENIGAWHNMALCKIKQGDYSGAKNGSINHHLSALHKGIFDAWGSRFETKRYDCCREGFRACHRDRPL